MERSKIVTIHKQDDSVHRKPYSLHQKIIWPNKWIQQNSRIQSQYSEIDELSERETKKKIPYTTAARKIKYLGIN